MQIGTLKLANPLILAPLAGITNLPMRLLARKAGCALVVTEMVSANGLVRFSEKTARILDSDPAERPLAVQLFGAEPEIVAEAAAMVEAQGADSVDINFGCAVRKVIKTGSGVALMRTPELAERLMRRVRQAIRVPLTIKIRSGWSADGAQALDIARRAADCGVDAIAVHPRTATQGFSGQADWRLIARIKAISPIPIIGNGDITSWQAALAMFEQTACDAVMIGRHAIGHPWIFSEIITALAGGQPLPVTPTQRRQAMLRYLEDSVKYSGELTACRMMRSRLAWFVKGLPNATSFRQDIKTLTSQRQAEVLIEQFFGHACVYFGASIEAEQRNRAPAA